MIPKGRSNVYEKVRCGEFVDGVISDIKRDEAHKTTWQGKEKIVDAVRIIFKLDGYEFPHGTPWMSFTYGDKSNLYKKFMVKLVENAKPDMVFDIELLKGMAIRTVWADNGDYQNLELIQPLTAKYPFNPGNKEPSVVSEEVNAEEKPEEEIPF
jgi:hypothetical protein